VIIDYIAQSPRRHVISDYKWRGSVAREVAMGGSFQNRKDWMIERWWIVVWAGAAASGVCAAIVWSGNGDLASVRAAVRISARMSAVLFCLAFASSALAMFFSHAGVRWLRRNRRHVGLAFGAVHLVHAAAIATYATLHPAQFHAYMSPAMYALSGTGYAFLAALALTSSNRAQMWMGSQAWSALHWVGSVYIWLSFTNGFARRAVIDPSYWPWVGLLMAVAALRTAALVRRWRQRRGANGDIRASVPRV
jgi:sulfoxide reductase heme-binding subunit YedZ